MNDVRLHVRLLTKSLVDVAEELEALENMAGGYELASEDAEKLREEVKRLTFLAEAADKTIATYDRIFSMLYHKEFPTITEETVSLSGWVNWLAEQVKP